MYDKEDCIFLKTLKAEDFFIMVKIGRYVL